VQFWSGVDTYFHPNGSTLAQNKLRKAYGGSLFISGIENLPLPVQNTFIQIFDARQECELGDYEHKIAAVFVSSKLSLQDLRTEHDMDSEFLDSIFGTQILLPNLAQRMDFRKLATELLKEISPKHILAKTALDLLETREWPGHIRQLKKMLRVLVANSATTIIRPEAIEGDQNVSGSEIIPCAPCAQSPMRKESCVLIQKTWMESGGNVSLVSRRLGVSRTTIYKHISGK
jgi:transcriptional regulator of acetoin/glycerol metabolism